MLMMLTGLGLVVKRGAANAHDPRCGAADAEDAVQLMLMMLTSLVRLVKPGAVKAHNAQLPGACGGVLGS